MENNGIQLDYYEDRPTHITRLSEEVEYIDGFKNNRIILMVSFRNNTFIDDIVAEKHLNLVFTQTINARIHYRKSYSYTLEEIKNEDYWLSVVYLSINEDYLLEKEISKKDTVYDYLTILISDKPIISEKGILDAISNHKNIIFEDKTPFRIFREVEVEDNV